MLAGYLPFDDDPANPEGDNINLLYKYIVTTPLTFPEYVTPHARDILRRILVPNPRKRADLFEVARHSWLNDYAHALAFITSGGPESAEALPGSLSIGMTNDPVNHTLTNRLQKSPLWLLLYLYAARPCGKRSSPLLCPLAASTTLALQ